MKDDICGTMWEIIYSVKYFITVIKDFMVTKGNKYACYLAVILCTSQWIYINEDKGTRQSICGVGVWKNLLRYLTNAKSSIDYIS